MKKRLMTALAAGALVAATVPGVAAATEHPRDSQITVPGNNNTNTAITVAVPEVVALNFPND